MQSLKVEIEATQRSTMLGLESTAKAQAQEIAQLRTELSSFVQELTGRLQQVKTSVDGILVVGEARPALDAQFQAELTQQQEQLRSTLAMAQAAGHAADAAGAAAQSALHEAQTAAIDAKAAVNAAGRGGDPWQAGSRPGQPQASTTPGAGTGAV